MNTVIKTRAHQTAALPSNYEIGTATGTVFTLEKGEVGFIQNVDDVALHVKLGASASTTSFNYLLNAGDAAADGKGGYLVIDDYEGVVSVAPASGTASYIAWKRVVS